MRRLLQRSEYGATIVHATYTLNSDLPATALNSEALQKSTKTYRSRAQVQGTLGAD